MMRRAKRRIRKGKFPFPEFAKFLRSQTSINPKIFAQVRPGNQYITNLSGEKQTLDLPSFYQLLKEKANET
jgi:hypothetical protein